jgi:hypothetical protein
MSDHQQGFWKTLGAKRFAPGKGVAEPPPQGGWRRFFFVLGTHFSKLISLNVLFLVFSLPVLTLPAALCGLNRVLIKLYRDGNCFVWEEFIKEFRANIWKAMPFGFAAAFCLFASYYFLSLGTSMTQGGVEVITTALGILLLVFAVLFFGYVFVFLPTLELKNAQIARNAFIFTVTEWRTNGIILAMSLATVLFSLLLFPFSIVTLALFSIAFLHYTVCAAVNTPLQRRIIGPYEEKEQGKLK